MSTKRWLRLIMVHPEDIIGTGVAFLLGRRLVSEVAQWLLQLGGLQRCLGDPRGSQNLALS